VLAVALGSVLALTVCTTLAPAAVLLAPDAAVAAAAGAPPLRRAEILLLAGRPAEARAALVGAAADDPRALRILAESFALEVDLVGARPALAALAALPTWASPARQTEAHLARARGARAVVRGAILTFVLCLSLLALSGARELLRFHPESAVFAVAGIGAAVWSRGLADQAGPAVDLAVAAVFFLVHAAAAARRRLRPGARGRLLLITLALLGALGAGLALGLELGLDGLIQVASASARPPG
jgi:hypothetical protein